MTPGRHSTYEHIRSRIGNTPLLDVSIGPSQRIWAKAEFLNPGGSHHDRQFIELLYEDEMKGKIKKHDTLLEVTTGSAGASLAWVAAELGFQVKLVIPAWLPNARRDAMMSFGDHVQIMNDCLNMPECVRFARDLMTEHRDWHMVNHSRRLTSITSLRGIGVEAAKQMGGHFTHFVGVVGTGNSIVGPASALPGTHVHAWEPYDSGAFFDSYNPGHFHKKFDRPPGDQHDFYGASFTGVKFPHYAHVRDLVDAKAFHLVLHHGQAKVTPNHTLDVPTQWGGFVPLDSVSWSAKSLPVGRTSMGSLAVAGAVHNRNSGRKILTILYDSITRY